MSRQNEPKPGEAGAALNSLTAFVRLLAQISARSFLACENQGGHEDEIENQQERTPFEY